jgi:hypothetical protein
MTIDADYSLSGPTICRLMRRHKVTIDILAKRYQLSKSRIRQVRREGVRGFLGSEWHYMITGRWLDLEPF